LAWMGLLLPLATGFFPGGDLSIPRNRGHPESEGEAGRLFSVVVPFPVRSHGLPVSFILNVGSVGVA
jgi:hypothetical protein